ncbi:MAG: S8 family serine peptidase [Nitriliruptor sp.]
MAVFAAVTSSTAPAAAQSDDEVATFDVDDPYFEYQDHLRTIRAPEAWTITRGDPEVTLAIVDTGVSDEHRDLRGAFWSHPTNGGAGYDHLRRSRDTYVSGEVDWHGTAIAGIAAARANDGYGISGVAPEVSVMVRRIYASEDEFSSPVLEGYGDAVAAIYGAAAEGADVILLPWGGTRPNADLVRAIRDVGVPVVAAAGNDGVDLSQSSSPRRYPAAYELSNLVTVAATDGDGALWREGESAPASNYGVDSVGLAAPGASILAPDAVTGSHSFGFSGTSYAAPQVAAALALGRSIAPNAPAAELVGEVVRSARRSGALRGKVTSGGVLDVQAFLRGVQRPACDPFLPPAPFVDVDRSGAHYFNVDCVSFWEVARGVAEDRFAPDRQVTRAQMASFLTRVIALAGELPEDPPDAFTDDDTSTHVAAIDALAALGIAQGDGDGRFSPDGTVTRAQMASFVVRTVELLTDRPAVSDRTWFDDVQGTAHERTINAARELTITLGSSEPRLFEPGRTTRRDHMASFLARTLDALRREGVPLTRSSSS